MNHRALALLLCALPALAIAQDGVDPKHENHFRDVPPIETDALTLSISDAHAQRPFAKFKAQITNNTADFLLYYVNETVFHFEHGDFKPNNGDAKRKPVIIGPKDSKNPTVGVDGEDGFHREKFSVDFSGFYRVSAEGTVHEAPNFKLPAATNSFEAGPYRCSLSKVKQETKETYAKFKCTYTGDKVGLVTPRNLTVKTESGQTFANDDRKGDTELLFPGDDLSFSAIFHVPASVVDMQFANLEVVWTDTFREAEAVALEVPSQAFELDPGKTAGKN
ncbi:MAG: hypothetical protein H6739_24620 [Alphaproteobacteria bacterium]|nr:hypothetical protein [Alphaproteobacteria bacterium]